MRKVRKFEIERVPYMKMLKAVLYVLVVIFFSYSGDLK